MTFFPIFFSPFDIFSKRIPNSATGFFFGVQCHSITTIITNTTTIEYKPTPQVENAVLPANSVYPYIADSSPRNLVASITTNDGRTGGGSYTTTYEYYNGKTYTGYPYDRKSQYFEYIKERTGSGPYTITYYEHGTTADSHYYAGKVNKVEQYNSSGQLMKLVDYSWTKITPYTGVNISWVRPTSIIDYTYESGASNQVFYNSKTFDSYDNYGNPTQITEQSSDSGLPNIVTQMIYNYNTDLWIVARPSEIKQFQGSTSGTLLSHQRFYYNAKNELQTKEVWLKNATEDRFVATSFEYDNWGNVTRIIAPNSSGGTSYTDIAYDTNYQTFPVSIKNYNNGITYETIIAYDYATGQKTDVTDYNGIKTHYEYDGYKRLIKVYENYGTFTGDLVKTIDYVNFGNPATQHVKVQSYSESGKFTFEREYFDGLKRKYMTESKGYQDYNRVITYEYDELGRLKKKSNPYLSGCTGEGQYYTTYGYNNAGRLYQKIYDKFGGGTDSETFTYSYESNRAIVSFADKKGIEHKSYYDSRGKLRRRTDPAVSAYINYTYDSLGRLTSTDASGSVTSIAYDSLGRKTSIADPNTGTTRYTYWDSGQIASLTDQKTYNINSTSVTFSYEYDSLNRLIREKDKNGAVFTGYRYDDTVMNNSKGRLSEVTDKSGKTTFSYDVKGNVEGYFKDIDDNGDGNTEKHFAVAMQYDWQKRMTAMTYPDPDHTIIKKQYADAGYLEAVTDNNNNAYVQYARKVGGTSLCSDNSIIRKTGNGVTTTIQYDPANLRPVSLKTEYGTRTLENYSYTHDAMGNITNITDNDPSDPNNPYNDNVDDSEDFEYDAINRLWHATSPGGLYGTTSAYTYTYSPDGKLTMKDNLLLTYGSSSHPHAVTAYDGKSYGYDANGNMTSRIGKTLVYDAKNRLIEVRNSNNDLEESYVYDYTGFRVLKILADGTKIYNVNGLHELRVVPGQQEMIYTNFIYGMNNDLVAQIAGTTTTGASIYPVAKNLYNWKDLKGFFLKLHAYASAFFENPASGRNTSMAFLILVLIGAIGLLIYNMFFRKRHTLIIPRWMAHAIPMLLIVFLASFGTTGCFELFPNGVVYGVSYFHPNHNGSVKMITQTTKDANNNDVFTVVARYKYKPYGEVLADKSSGTNVSKYRYTAQEADDSTGLYYYNARFYDPAVGRFITVDTEIANPLNSQDYNRYMYVNGNPVMFNDPSGHGLGSMIKSVVGKTGNAISNIFKDNIQNAIKHTAHSVKDTFNSAKNWVKDNSGKIRDRFEGSLIGGLIGGPIGEFIGGYLGKDWLVDKDKEFRDKVENTVGSGDWWHKQWESWLKTTVCIIVVVVIIVVCIYLWWTGSWVWGSALICAILGVAYGGTNGGEGGKWSWEGAAAGAILGVYTGLTIAGFINDPNLIDGLSLALTFDSLKDHKRCSIYGHGYDFDDGKCYRENWAKKAEKTLCVAFIKV